ncbi:SGNH/GDSL hydrolase family protein [Virgibacillus litoralis]|uniref:Lysophospholipase L1-like esterase n=1 Tax=Virgibacillus litoralis TaxID=578221 RepID=A0ABS4HBS7_9BACI|nr:lysophospholipase L1-like esterase [Virgibacillus litoralis]
MASTSKWKGKKWTVVGDSNTEYNWAGTVKYHGYLALNLGCTVQNLGLSGSGWFNSWNGNDAYHLRLNHIDNDADLITFAGGGNDYAETERPFVLGSFGDTDPEASFYGAIDTTLNEAIEMYPNATIAMFTQFRRDVGEPTNAQLESMVQAELEVAGKYGIPCLDLYHQANQYPWKQWWREKYMTDGIHLNDEGHKKLADKIVTFLESL